MNPLQKALTAFSFSPRLRPLWNATCRCTHHLTKTSILATKPRLYLAYARLCKPGDFWTAPDPGTELLIEAPGGSATHSLVAYVRAHNPDLKIAHQCEAPATVLYCARRGIPVIVPVRDLDEYIRSVTDRFPTITRRDAERIHRFFYRTLAPVREQILLADFPDILARPAEVLERCNARFGIDLDPGDNELPHIRTLIPDGPEG